MKTKIFFLLAGIYFSWQITRVDMFLGILLLILIWISIISTFIWRIYYRSYQKDPIGCRVKTKRGKGDVIAENEAWIGVIFEDKSIQWFLKSEVTLVIF